MKNRKNSPDLSWEERQEIYRLRKHGYGIREIARIIGRAASTVSVELRRHRREKGWFELPWYEKARRAHEAAKDRRGRPRERGWGLKNEAIRQFVTEQLKDKLSPKSISISLPKRYPRERISHEAIYQYIYQRERSLLKYLVYYGKTKRTNRGSKYRSRLRVAEVSKRRIDERSKAAGSRKEFGHNESDFIVSAKGGKSCLLVFVERKTRIIRLAKAPNREAETTRKKIFKILHGLPQATRRSLTVDNDTAHVNLPTLEGVFRDDNFLLYWCNPYSAWERGTVEAINGILRRWFPKGTNFDEVSESQIAYVEQWFNRRPMEALNGLTPNEAFDMEISKAA